MFHAKAQLQLFSNCYQFSAKSQQETGSLPAGRQAFATLCFLCALA
jgi:hypothetical protein